MSEHDEAQKVIESAMRDPAVYAKLAARENEVWGKILPALAVNPASGEDAAASSALRMGRHHSSLPHICKEKNLHFERAVSLGCGAGRLERYLLDHKVCRQAHGIDISDAAIDAARQSAAADNLPVTYEAADLNFVELPESAFDLVVAQTSLHHVLFLEHVAFQAWRTLKPDGYMWVHDFVGETQGQYAEKRLQIINELLAILPEKFRANRISNRTATKIVRPAPGRLGSPFEKIRSAEIVPVLTRLFDVEWKTEFTAFLDLVAPTGTRAAFNENEDTRTLLEVLHLMESICLREGIIEPVGGQYLLRPKNIDRSTPFDDIFPHAIKPGGGPAVTAPREPKMTYLIKGLMNLVASVRPSK